MNVTMLTEVINRWLTNTSVQHSKAIDILKAGGIVSVKHESKYYFKKYSKPVQPSMCPVHFPEWSEIIIFSIVSTSQSVIMIIIIPCVIDFNG